MPVDQAAEPHPEAKQFRERLQGASSGSTPPIEKRREAQRRRALSNRDPEPVGAVADEIVRGNGHGLPVRVYTPDGEGPFPVLVWAHGGGFTMGDIETEDETARVLTNAARRVVVSVDYRLAPEHPFPAALEDVYRAVEWISENAGEYGGTPEQIAVGGQSAGANLAAATALYARDQNGPSIDRQVLVVPVVAYFEEVPGAESGDDDGVPDSEYLANPLHGRNPYAFPLEASDFQDLPPATILTAGFDEKRFHGKAYAERLVEAGVPVSHHHYPDTIHFFFIHFGADEWDRARKGVQDIAHDLEA